MKPASFEYYGPRTIEEALDRIGEVGNDGGKILAGGQSSNSGYELPSRATRCSG